MGIMDSFLSYKAGGLDVTRGINTILLGAKGAEVTWVHIVTVVSSGMEGKACKMG
jgi:hypothetical protein